MTKTKSKKKIIFLIIILIIGIGFFAFRNPIKEKEDEFFQPKTISTKQEILDYLIEVAFGTEFGEDREEAKLIKWTKPQVTIKKYGNFNQYLANCLDQIIADFNALSETTKLGITDSDNDIDLYLVPKEQFTEIEPGYVPGNEGFFYITWDKDNVIISSTILINSVGQIGDKARCHLMREELTQSMGLGQDSDKYSDSIFERINPRRIDYLDLGTWIWVIITNKKDQRLSFVHNKFSIDLARIALLSDPDIF